MVWKHPTGWDEYPFIFIKQVSVLESTYKYFVMTQQWPITLYNIGKCTISTQVTYEFSIHELWSSNKSSPYTQLCKRKIKGTLGFGLKLMSIFFINLFNWILHTYLSILIKKLKFTNYLFSFVFQLQPLSTQLNRDWSDAKNGNDINFWELEWRKYETCSLNTFTRLVWCKRW